MSTKVLDERELCDLECLSIGAFAPLTSFMTQAQYNSCLDTMRISESDVFPIPIVCTVPHAIDAGTLLTLKNITGTTAATLQVTECWQPDLTREWTAVFGSDDPNHPYIQYMKTKGSVYYVSGSLTVDPKFQFHSSYTKERSTPAELRAAGPWIGFQTRNPLHRSHIELICRSAASLGAAGPKVLLHPVEGVTQECDIPFPVRMKCYRKILPHLRSVANATEATLSILPLSMRMAGPREAVWHAVIRRNYGCSHFIVGRDHAGPSYKKRDGSSFYGPLDAQRLAKSLEEEIGITIVTSEEVVYCDDIQAYKTTSEAAADNHPVKQISGTQLRASLEKGAPISEWYSYPDVVSTLQDFYQRPKGLCVYFVGLSGSGKSTLANALKASLQEEMPHREVTLLDADEIRTHLSKGLGFSHEDRSTNVRRIGYVVSEIVRHGGIVVVANIAPFEADRAANRALIGHAGGTYLEVFVDTALETCEARDVKGLYKAARAGTIKQFTGISNPFESPVTAHRLSEQSLETAIQEVWGLVRKHL
jgi:sulfate adenylyltransferase